MLPIEGRISASPALVERMHNKTLFRLGSSCRQLDVSVPLHPYQSGTCCSLLDFFSFCDTLKETQSTCQLWELLFSK